MSARKKRRKAKAELAAESGTRRGGREALLGFTAAIIVLGVWWFARRADVGRWNVVLISIDTLRADHVGAYGGTVPTPHMDRLALEGVRFETVQTVAPTTLPAHASLFTGELPPSHGVHDNVGFYLDEGKATLASHLRKNGYRTGGFVGAFVLDSRFGIAQGFDEYFDDFDALTDDVSAGFVSQRPGADVVSRALAWLDEVRQGEAPFFAFVHLYEPHTPYEPPPEFVQGLDDRSRYRGEVAYTDALVGRILGWLDELGLEDETLVLLTSDHGESLGEHGERTHGLFVYESTLRVPLILRYPGAPAGTRVPALVRLVDVTPTVVDLLRIPAFERIEGRSLLPLVEEPGREWNYPAYAETFVPRLGYGWSELRALRSGRHKLILAPSPELYDLEQDPDESDNLFDREPEIARDLREALGEAPVLAPAAEIDAGVQARLESLGYFARGVASPSPADPKDRIELYDVLNDPALKSVEPSDGPGFAEAVSLLETSIREEPTMPRAYVLYGELLVKAGRHAEAQKVFEKLLSFEPTFEGFYGLGMASQNMGELEQAERAYRNALAIEPRNTKSHYRLSEVEAARGDVEAAERWLREGIELNSDRMLQHRLAALLLDTGRAEEARAIFDRIASKDGDDPVALYNLAQSLLVDGRAESALEIFRRAAGLRPEDADLQQGIGNALLSMGRLDLAAQAFERAVALSPCFAGAYTNLGLTYAQLGRLQEAIGTMTKAVACDPGYVLGYKNLAAVQLESGDVAGAIETLRRASRRAPGDPEIERNLAELVAFHRRNP